MTFSDSLLKLLSRKKSKHQGRSNLSYDHVHFNRSGTKLVRKFYGEEAARQFNS